jgi:hypothetical protein
MTTVMVRIICRAVSPGGALAVVCDAASPQYCQSATSDFGRTPARAIHLARAEPPQRRRPEGVKSH